MVEELLIAAATVLVVASVLGALIGRPDQSRPVCRGCRADARPNAWNDEPRCPCGAPLGRIVRDGPSGVGFARRVRSARGVKTALLVLVAGTVLFATAVVLRASRLAWIDLVPYSWIASHAEALEPWALASAARRMQSPWLPATDAVRLTRVARSPNALVVMNEHWPSLGSALHNALEAWRSGGRPGGVEAMITMAGLTVQEVAGGPPVVRFPEAPDRVLRTVHLKTERWGEQSGAAVVRIERVLVDGEPAPWWIGRRPPPLGLRLDGSPPPPPPIGTGRAIVSDEVVRILAPDASGSGRGSIVIEATIIDSPIGWHLLGWLAIHEEGDAFLARVADQTVRASIDVPATGGGP
jgi:hypothetical protein